MNKRVSVDFQFSVQQLGRGAKKRLVESYGESNQPNKSLERIPRFSRCLALAIHFEDLIGRGIVTNFADLACLGQVTRARVTQIMNLRLLAPAIQEQIILDVASAQECSISELQRIALQKTGKCEISCGRKFDR